MGLPSNAYESYRQITRQIADELGDTLFFCILSGVLHWPRHKLRRKAYINEVIERTLTRAEMQETSIASSIQNIVEGKNKRHYQSMLFTLGVNEKTLSVPSRVNIITQHSRELRPLLRTKDASTPLVTFLSQEYSRQTDHTVKNSIKLLCEAALIDLAV